MAVMAAPCNVSAAPCGMSAATCGESAALHGMTAAPDTHGNSRGLERPSGGRGGNIHEKLLWYSIA